jgi:7-carboxy-7-deazaguanine synthase
MPYHVNEIFKTIQGEGYWTGRAAVFCRFSRCNLWTGREADRARSVCQFCDTDFTASTKYDSATTLVEAIEVVWGKNGAGRRVDYDEATGGNRPAMVVLTGGEPLLQVDDSLTEELHRLGFYVAVETNGTIRRPDDIDWLCVSPKVNAQLVINRGDELKLVYPQGPDPSVYLALAFSHFWLSPMDGPDYTANLEAALGYVQDHPQWRLNIQTHKVIGVK